MNDFQHDLDMVAQIDAIPRLLDVICRTTGLGFAAVARVTENRWITCHVLDHVNFGLKIGDELEVETTFCHEIRQNREPVVINCVAESEKFRDHHTPAKYGLQSYISMPIVLDDGRFFGTLCALDPKPAKLENVETIEMFRLFAELIATQLSAGNRLESVQQELVGEQKLAELREQFIAVLGHDLRNPIASIDAGTRMLERSQQDERSVQVIELMKGSVRRMSSLVENLMDFARGRLGGGLALERKLDNLIPVLDLVVKELQTTHPGTRIEERFAFVDPINCDQPKIGQMLSNLLANALTHGEANAPVKVIATDENGVFELCVINSGEPIEPEAMHNLFQPFFRSSVRPSKEGLGLGLYIASEIAKSHGGSLTARSDKDETVFRFSMPIPQ